MEANNMNPNQTAPKGVNIACNISLATYEHKQTRGADDKS